MTDQAIGLHTLIARKTGLPETTVDDDLVILNLLTQNYVGLDDIGRAVWEYLAEPRRVEDVCRAMTERYAGPPDEIRTDMMTFLSELLAEKLIVVVETL
jgi:hypothetical protein